MTSDVNLKAAQKEVADGQAKAQNLERCYAEAKSKEADSAAAKCSSLMEQVRNYEKNEESARNAAAKWREKAEGLERVCLRVAMPDASLTLHV